MSLTEAEYLLPSVDSLDAPLELGCGIIAPREDSDEDDSELGMPTLLPPPPSPSSEKQEEVDLEVPRLRHSSNVTWVQVPAVETPAGGPQQPGKKESIVDPLRCEHCSFRACSRHSLNNHHRQRHGEQRFRRMRQCQVCPVDGCEVTKFHSSRMVQHLNAQHGARIQKVQLIFNGLDEFLRWKATEERKVGVTFTKRTGDRHGLYGRSTNYTCSRFGTQMHRSSSSSSSRVLRLGYFQTDEYCPSRMNVVFYNNRLVVAYFRKHSHDVAAGPEYWVDLKSLPLKAEENEEEEMPVANEVTVKAEVKPLVYSSLCDNLTAQMNAISEHLRAGIPESLLESVMDVHGRHARLLAQLTEKRNENRVFPLVLKSQPRR